MTAETVILILKLLDLLATVAIRGTEVQSKFSTLREEISTMVAEGRGPTEEEWTSLNERADALHTELQGQG